MSPRRAVVALALVWLFLGVGQQGAGAHAALRASDPVSGSMLQAAPTSVRLTFSEEPQASLSSIRVVDSSGGAYQVGTSQAAVGDPHALEVRLGPLARGVYTVTWRAVSRVDGHPTAGAIDFGVGVLPAAVSAVARTESPPPSWSELSGRWMLIAGLVGLLGAAFAAAAGFGTPPGGALATTSWAASVVGLTLLADGQRRNAGGSLADLWGTPAGRALAWRAVALVVAGAALGVARQGRSGPSERNAHGPQRVRRGALFAVVAAALAAMGVDVAAGHTAGAHSARGAVIAAQWAHFAAAGVWLGGLAALLLHVRGAGSEDKAASVRRFSRVALAALGVVVLTGIFRALGELTSWGDLTSTGYGRAVLLKGVLLTAIVVLAAANRRWSVPVAATNPGRLRLVSGAEIVLAVGALGAAAALASLAPPVSARAGEPTGLTVSGADAATATRVRLKTLSASAGPNAFEVRAVDYDTGVPLAADRATLRFLPLDDPGAAPTSLALTAGPDHSWTASGANLAFDGRWRVSTILERRADSVVVPLEVQVRSAPQFVSVEEIPGQPIRYTVELAAGGYARVWADPLTPGPSALHVTLFDPNGEPRPVDHVVTAIAPAAGPARQRLARPVGVGRFVVDLDLPAGRATVAVVARGAEGSRLRASVDLDVKTRP